MSFWVGPINVRSSAILGSPSKPECVLVTLPSSHSFEGKLSCLMTIMSLTSAGRLGFFHLYLLWIVSNEGDSKGEPIKK